VFASFTLTLLTVIGPALVVVWQSGREDFDSKFHALGFTIVLSFLFFGATSALAWRVIPFSILGYSVVAMVSWGALFLIGSWTIRYLPLAQQAVPKSALGIVILFATLAVIDCYYILRSQHWGFEGGAAYFHGMQLDPVRNADIVAALLRGSDTLFLPQSHLVYQLFWNHLAARVVSVFEADPMRFHQVAGVAIATAWLLYALIAWLIMIIRPGAIGQRILFGLILIILITESPLNNSHVLMTWLGAAAQSLGQNLSGPFVSYLSTAAPYFQYMSIKLTALTAPQHVSFLICVIGLLATQWIGTVQTKEGQSALALLYAAAAVAVSPIFAAIFFPFFVLAIALSYVRSVRNLVRLVAAAAVAAGAGTLAFLVLFRFNPISLFLRQGATHPLVLLENAYAGLPAWQLVLSPIATIGFIGVVWIVAVVLAGASRSHVDATTRYWLALLASAVACFLFWNFVYSELELRRHAAIVIGLLAAVTIPIALASMHLKKWRGALTAGLALIAVYGLSYSAWSAYNLTHNPPTLAIDIPWHDYVCAADYIRRSRPNAKIIAASGEGVPLPIAAEAGTTLGPRLAMQVHQKVTPVHAPLFAESGAGGPFRAADFTPAFVQRLKDIGYDTVIWGPVEEAAWSYIGRAALLDKASPLYRCGHVFVYSLVAGSIMDESLTKEAAASIEYLRCEMKARAFVHRRIGIEANTALRTQRRPPYSEQWQAMSGETCSNLIMRELVAMPSRTPTKGGVGIVKPVTVRQSSILNDSGRYDASAAIDGNYEGLRSDGSPQFVHTGPGLASWWEADLGSILPIQEVRIWNLQDCCRTHSTGLVVLISDRPFAEQYDPLLPEIGVWGAVLTGGVREVAVPVGKSGRYIRIQKMAPGYLALTEVEILGRGDVAPLR
jgi:hypothetical protein